MTSMVLAAPPRLSAYDLDSVQFQAALWEVAGYLARMGLTTKYGFWLLHGHFSLDHEAIVQCIENNELSTRVVPRHQANGMAPTVWRIAPDGTLVPVQWAEAVAVPVATAIDPALAAFGDFLATAGLASTFVIVELAHTIKLGPDQVSLETTNELRRTQRTIAVPRSIVTEGQVAGWSAATDGTPVPRHFCTANGTDHHRS